MNTPEIVLIEDNPHDAEMTISALRENNIVNRIRHIRDGEEALNYLFGSGGTLQPKVILLDLKLPKVNGLEVLEKIRSDARTKYIPVVALTSSNEGKDRAECYRLGINSYVVKPVDYESFLSSVAEIGNYWVLLNKLPY